MFHLTISACTCIIPIYVTSSHKGMYMKISLNLAIKIEYVHEDITIHTNLAIKIQNK